MLQCTQIPPRPLSVTGLCEWCGTHTPTIQGAHSVLCIQNAISH